MSVARDNTELQENKQRRRRQIDALCQAGKLTPEQARQLEECRPRSHLPLDEELEKLGILTGGVGRALAKHFGCPFVDLSTSGINPDAAALLPADIARQFVALPLGCYGETARIALSDPSDVMAEDTIRRAIPRTVEFVAAAESHIRRAIEQLYGSDADFTSTSISINGLPTPDISRIEFQESDSLSSQELEFQAERLPVIRLANQIIGMAAARSASDIHIEPHQAELHVRLRIDGVPQDAVTLPRSIQPALLSRLKLMGEMDIADTRRPQDGRCRISVQRRVLDLRISSLPTTFGEKLVIRMLDQSGPPMTLDRLEMEPEDREALERMLSQPQGLLLVTGPTGSGKSTTLYASLCHLQKNAGNIVTVEDPVERQIPGINQVGINEKAGVTFATALKSILRQDPNVIMIGEIRDEETMEIALKAGLTGQLVLSTLHTGDAASTVTRLLDMGMPGNLLSPALIGVISQRLVRKLCEACKKRRDDDGPVGHSQLDNNRRTRGCEACGFAGFRGRVGIYELMENTPDLSSLISRGATAEEIRAAGRRQGMRSLADAALLKLEQGIIGPEDAAAIADVRTARSPLATGASPAACEAPLIFANDGASADTAARLIHSGSDTVFPREAAKTTIAPKILIVEDDENIRLLLQFALESHQYEVVLAENGAEGLKAAESETPDLIISDVMMPLMDGFEMCKLIRGDARTQSIPIILMTAQDGDEQEVRGLEAGADDYIQKPVRPKRLLARIRLILRRVPRR